MHPHVLRISRYMYKATKKKSPVSGLRTHLLRSARQHFYFYFVLPPYFVKRCPIAAKIAGLIGILPCCDLNDFHIEVWTFSRFVRPILATILCICGNLVPAYVTCVTYFPVGKKKEISKNKVCYRTDFEANRWPETGVFFFVLPTCETVHQVNLM